MQLTTRHYRMLGGSLVLVAALAVAAATLPRRSVPMTVPERTPIHVSLERALASDQSRPGEHFAATVREPIVVEGKTVIPEGAQVKGRVVDAHRSGRLAGRARLQLALETVEVNGKSYEIRTTSSQRVGRDHHRRNLAWIGGGAGGGVLIGALVGGGKGALIGGPVGAGAGTAVAFLSGKRDIKLPAETPLTFRLAQPVRIEVKG